MADFLIKVLLSPWGLIVLGVVLTGAGGEGGWWIIGLILTAGGIFWLIVRKKGNQKSLELHKPLYQAVVDELKKNGYEVQEYENKNDRIRAAIHHNGKQDIGELFLVAPPPSPQYKIFREVIEKVNTEFQYEYAKKIGEAPEVSASYWPENVLVGAYMQNPVENYSETGWMAIVANVINQMAA